MILLSLSILLSAAAPYPIEPYDHRSADWLLHSPNQMPAVLLKVRESDTFKISIHFIILSRR